MIDKNLDSHQKRNTKTAVMFAVCLSFLIFAGSTFLLIGKLVVSTLENQIGADFWGYDISQATYMDELPITKFLIEQ